MASTTVFEAFRSEWIVHRDETLIALNKPAGLSTAASDGTDDLRTRVQRWLARERGCEPEQVYVGVHEHLERDSSGLVLFTLDKRANAKLAAQFERRCIPRSYRVITTHDRAPRLLPETTSKLRPLREQLARDGAPAVGDVQHGGVAAHRAMCHAESLRLVHPMTDDALHLHAKAPRSLIAPTSMRHAIHHDVSLRQALALEAAIKRASVPDAGTQVLRWVNGEHDGFEGLAVDVYDRWLVLHVFDEAWLPHLDALTQELMADAAALGVYVKRHPKQKNELSKAEIAVLALDRPWCGQAAPDPLRVLENGVPLHVRLGDGLRTGLFLDQRDNRGRIKALAAGCHVLNLFAYTCGFSVAALAGGARTVTSVDASQRVMSRVEPSLAALGAEHRHQARVGDCFDMLTQLREQGARFDLIILDPPSYASTRAGRFKLRRDYSTLVAEAIAVASPNATLLCATNHHGTTPRELRAFGQDALQRARKTGEVKVAQPIVDFAPMPGREPEMKSIWITLTS